MLTFSTSMGPFTETSTDSLMTVKMAMWQLAQIQKKVAKKKMVNKGKKMVEMVAGKEVEKKGVK